eukprot:Platyproteum_vivax@DN3900_c0_g1_i1.p1
MGNAYGSKQSCFTLNAHKGPVGCLHFYYDTLIPKLVSSGGSSVAIHNVIATKVNMELSIQHQMQFPNQVGDTAFTSLGDYLLVASSGGLIWLYDTKSWRAQDCLDLHEKMFCPRICWINCTAQLVDASPGCLHFCRLFQDKGIEIQDESLAVGDYFRCLDVSPIGDVFAIGSDVGSVQIFGVGECLLLQIVEAVAGMGAHASKVNVVRFAPDSSVLASGCDDGIVKVWNLESQELQYACRNSPIWSQLPGTQTCDVTNLKGHRGPVYDIKFPKDKDGKWWNRIVVSGGADGEVWLWRLASADGLREGEGGVAVHVLKANSTGSIPLMVFSVAGIVGRDTDGRGNELSVAAGCEDGSIRVWTMGRVE